MKNNVIISIFVVICFQLLVKVSVFAEDEFVLFEDYPIEPCGTVRFQGSFEDEGWAYFRVNPANPDEAIIFDPINDDILLEIPSYYDGDNFETPRVVTNDGKELIPTIIDESVAGNIFGYENIKITSNIKHISKFAFWGADAKNVILEEGLVSIDDGCFHNFTGITELLLPNSLYSIGNNSFTYAENLKKIIFGKGLYEVGDHSFSNNVSITEVELPENLHRLGEGAFDNCTNLKKVTIAQMDKRM